MYRKLLSKFINQNHEVVVNLPKTLNELN